MILTLTPNPCVDKTVFIESYQPGDRVRAQRYACVAGGKGNNVSRAVQSLGYDTVAMPIVGGHTGQHVVQMLEEEDGLRCEACWVADSTRTITTVLEESAHRQTAFFEPGSKVTAAEKTAVLERFAEVVTEAQVVTFNGMVPDPILNALYQECIEIAKDAGVITILDSYQEPFLLGLEAQPYMVKPNLEELEQILGDSFSTREAQWKAIGSLHERGVTLVVVSLGADGALVSQDGEQFKVVPPAIEEINPVGSGDALVAGFAIGLQESWPLQDTARFAIAAGTANAMSWDIGHFSKDEVDNLVEQVRVELH